MDTSETGLTIQALVNFTNPTNYSATVPFVDIRIEVNGTVLGHVKVEDAIIRPGNNTNVLVKAFWEPSAIDGDNGTLVGEELLSQYISGMFCPRSCEVLTY